MRRSITKSLTVYTTGLHSVETNVHGPSRACVSLAASPKRGSSKRRAVSGTHAGVGAEHATYPSGPAPRSPHRLRRVRRRRLRIGLRSDDVRPTDRSSHGRNHRSSRRSRATRFPRRLVAHEEHRGDPGAVVHRRGCDSEDDPRVLRGRPPPGGLDCDEWAGQEGRGGVRARDVDAEGSHADRVLGSSAGRGRATPMPPRRSTASS